MTFDDRHNDAGMDQVTITGRSTWIKTETSRLGRLIYDLAFKGWMDGMHWNTALVTYGLAYSWHNLEELQCSVTRNLRHQLEGVGHIHMTSNDMLSSPDHFASVNISDPPPKKQNGYHDAPFTT